LTLTPFTLERFGALNLSDDPFEVGSAGARDMSNVRLDQAGRLKTRGGFDTLNSTALTGLVAFVPAYHSPTGQRRYLAASTTSGGTFRVYAIGLATHTDYTAVSVFGSGTFGTFTGGVLGYTGGWLLSRSDDVLFTVALNAGGTSITAPTGWASTPRARYLTMSGVEGRTIAAYSQIGGAPLPYRVHFSAVDSPVVWGLTDYVDIWAGDDQQIRAAVTYRDQVFVFKDRRFAVFYGESVDADGGVIFNYRPVDVGIGCAYDYGAAVGPDGVYFIATDGIYRTAGDAPTLISGALQPLFDGATDSDWTGPTSIVTPKLFATQDRLYFVNDSKVFSYRYQTGEWTFDVYSPGVQFMALTSTIKPRGFYFLDGTGKACEAGDTFADDDGSPIAWSYKSGRYALAENREAAVTQESSVVGSGTVAMSVTTDLYGTLAGPGATLGTAPAVAEGWPMTDQEGTWFQYTLSGTGLASVSRLTHYVRSIRPTAVR
jgi:hypothetical protein